MKRGNARGAKGTGSGIRVVSIDGKNYRRKCRLQLTAAEATLDLWSCVKSSIWSERMLTALEYGVQAGVKAFLAQRGFITLTTTHAPYRQSSSR